MHNSRTGGGKSKLGSAAIGKPLFISSMSSGKSAGPELLCVLCNVEE